MNAIILAGGSSLRMGFDKTLIKVEGLTLMERQIRLLSSLCDKIMVVTNNQQKSDSLYALADKNRFKKIEIIQDIVLGQGPLGGIYSGLKASDSFYNFVLACDMPYIACGLIEYMYKESSGFDAVVPRSNKRYEPLYSLYSKSCLKIIKKLLDENNRKIKEVFAQIRLRVITQKEILKFAPAELVFMNINTPDQMRFFQSHKGKNSFSYA